MGGKSGQTTGYRYYLGVEACCCLGPVDSFTQLMIGDRVAWVGQSTGGTIDIDQPNLFGGDKQEGGVSGIIEVRQGFYNQVADPYMTAYLGRQLPANRGLFCLIFRGRSYNEIVAAGLNTGGSSGLAFGVSGSAASGGSGGGSAVSIPVSYVGPTSFMWSSNNPYIKTITPTVTRILSGWGVQPWYSRAATITQSIDYANPPNGSDTQQSYLRNACAATDTVLAYPVNTTDLDPTFTGYAQIENEWVKITQLITDTAGNSSYYWTFTCVRGMWNTTPVAHAAGATIYFYQASVVPIVAMNPAHILYQIITDPDWGLGKDPSVIDGALYDNGLTVGTQTDSTWGIAADQLYAEGFGLCMIWSEQTSIEDFCTEVLKHIDGILDFNLVTGLYELRLVRNDYDATTLPVFDETNIVGFENFSRSGWGETTNEMIIKFTDQATGKVASISVQDLANINIQGGVVSQTHTYAGVQDPSLATRLGIRDLTALSTPLASMSIKVNRSGWSVKKGDPIKVSWNALAITQLICRVVDIDYGSLEDGTLTFTLIEDVFALPTSAYVNAQPGTWSNPSSGPRAIATAVVLEVPYMVLQSIITTTSLAGTESYPLIFSQKPGSQNTQAGIYQSQVAAFTSPVSLGTSDYNSTVQAATAILWSDTTIAYGNAMGDSPDIYTGGLALIDNEWVGITSVNLAASTMIVVRGVLDSIPVAHASGALVWFFSNGAVHHGFIGTSAPAVSYLGDTEYYSETGKSGSTETRLTGAIVQAHTHAASWNNPYPPANVQFGGEYFPATLPASFTLTWGGRNRLQQIVGLVGWTDSSLAPESGVTYTLNVYDATTDALIASVTGLTATVSGGSYTYATPAPTGTTGYKIAFFAVRGSLTSQTVALTAMIQ